MGQNILGNSHHVSVVSGQSKGSALKKNERGHGSTKHLIVQASTQTFLDKVLRWALFMKHNFRFCAVLTTLEFMSCTFYKYCIVARKRTSQLITHPRKQNFLNSNMFWLITPPCSKTA